MPSARGEPEGPYPIAGPVRTLMAGIEPFRSHAVPDVAHGAVPVELLRRVRLHASPARGVLGPGSVQVTHDGLFTTLDSLSRQLILPNHQKIVLSDTVGFLHELPHHLIESFKETLEETASADLLIHVVDVSHPKFRNLHASVMAVLKELDAHEKPMITVLNKIDRLESKAVLRELKLTFTNAVAVSALSGENIPGLLEEIAQQLSSLLETVEVALPLDRMDLVNLAHKEGHVNVITYDSDAVRLSASLPKKFAGLLQKFSIRKR